MPNAAPNPKVKKQANLMDVFMPTTKLYQHLDGVVEPVHKLLVFLLHSRIATGLLISAAALAVTGCPGRSEPAHPLVMPVRGTPPPRLSPVTEVEVDDAEDGRLVGTGAPDLLGAVETYRAGNHQAALARFFEVMRDPLRPSMPKHLAELYAAKSLLGLELPHTAWMILDGIAHASHHMMRIRALPWLGLLASHIDTDAVLESLATYDPADRKKLTRQKPPLMQRLAYLFGRHAFLQGEERASALLGEVGEDSADYPKALFMLGVTRLKAKEPDAALEMFDAVLASLIRPGLEEPERIRAMTSMARARVLYEQGDESPDKLVEALEIYKRAQAFDDVRGDARVETVWTLLRLERLDEAHAELAAAKPELSTRHAEVDGLEVMVQLQRCELDEAATLLAAAKERHRSIQARIDELLKEGVADRVGEAVLFGARGRKPKTPDQEVIAIAARRTRLARMLRRFTAIREEQKKANALPLDFKQSAAGKKVSELVDAAIARTETAVAEHLAAELKELAEITAGHLAEYEKMEKELAARRSSGC